jgi:hypothetical protein
MQIESRTKRNKDGDAGRKPETDLGRPEQSKHVNHAHNVFASNCDANAKTAIYWTHKSDCVPDVPQQLIERIELTRDCPCFVRLSEND